MQPYRVVIHGLPHFSRKLERLLQCKGWEVRYHACRSLADTAALVRDLSRADLVYTWGGRVSQGKFLRSANLLGVKNLVMLWSGSDIFFAQEQVAAGKMDRWIAGMTHWAVSPWIADEARALGLPCEFVQASFVEPVSAIAPMPERFSVLSYVPSIEKSALYGWNEIKQVAAALPAVEFNIVGVQEGQTLDGPDNVKVAGWATDLAPHIRSTAAVWRPVRHDGLSFMVLESLAQGRHVLYSYPFVGCVHTPSTESARSEIERLHSLHRTCQLKVNAAGMEAIARDFTPQTVRASLLRRWEHTILTGRGTPNRSLSPAESREAANEASR